MPNQYNDIFDDLVLRINPEVNPYVEELLKAEGSNPLPLLYGSSLKNMQGSWRRHFSNQLEHPCDNRDLILEIGCHKGKNLLEAATKYPDKLFIGMDITFKRVVMTARRAQKQNLRNILIVFGSARSLDLIFNPEELDGIMAFFPDPWQKKKRQLKNRLFSAPFLATAYTRIKPNGFFWFKTDSKCYFDGVRTSSRQLGLSNLDNPQGFLGEKFTSVFEERFLGEGLEIHSRKWVKYPNLP